MLEQKFIEIAFDGDEGGAQRVFGSKGPYFTHEMHLAQAVNCAKSYQDLSPVLLATGKEAGFITSDHPSILYNQYCQEHGQGRGITGAITQGLQVFFPVTPSLCLLLFDSEVYRLSKRRRGNLMYITKADLDQINQLEVVLAGDAVYFPRFTPLSLVETAVQLGLPHRTATGPRVAEAIDEENHLNSLIHQYEAIPNLEMNLSFLKLRHEARRTPSGDRMNRCRRATQHIALQMTRDWEESLPEEARRDAYKRRSYKFSRRM